MDMTMEMTWKDSNILSRSACADDVTLCNRRDYARYAHVGVSGSGQWCTRRAAPRNHWMLSLVSASYFVTKQSCSIHYYEISTSCPNAHLVVRLHQFIITYPCSHFVHTLAPRKHVIWGVVFTPTLGYSRPTSAVNDPSVTKQMNSRKSCLEEVSQLLVYQVALF